MVIPPANTGRLKTNKKAVTQTLTKNSGMLYQAKLGAFKLFIVHKKLIDPAIDLTPAKCNLKITKSTVLVECPNAPLKGG